MNTVEYIQWRIGHAEDTRREVARMRTDAFRATEGIGAILTAHIGELKALDIPKSLQQAPMLEQLRDAEIGACEDLLRIWLKTRGQSAPLQRLTAAFVHPETGELIELGEGYLPPDGIVHTGFDTADERAYLRNGVVLRVIDGGKK